MQRSLYRRPEWKALRSRAIEHVDGRCEECGKDQNFGAFLQVHHRKYIKFRCPWEYNFDELRVLCRGCHAEVHGKILSRSNWNYEFENDLGSLSGVCGYCGNDIRYEHHISHERDGDLVVGTYCADSLTQTKEASERQRLAERRARFLKSKRWKLCANGSEVLNQGSFSCEVYHLGNAFRIRVNEMKGKLIFQNLSEAKTKLFELINNGALESFFKSRDALKGE